MSTRLALRIQEHLDSLAPSERRLASLVLERQDDMLTYSATELAEAAGVSKATAARLFRSLGYRDFNEVRLQAREERNRTAPFEQRAEVQPTLGRGRSIGAHLQMEVANLTRTFEDLRSDRLNQAAELLAEAPRLWLLGLGPEEGLMRHARLLFSRLRPNVQLLGHQPASLAEDLALTAPRDVLLVATAAPRPKALRPILDYVRTTRMSVITVTNGHGSAFAKRFSTLVLTIHMAGLGLGASYTALASMLDLLSIATGERIGGAAQQRNELIAAIHDELEDLE